MEPDELPTLKGIGGDAYTVAGSNGRLGAGSLSLQGAMGKPLDGLAWRIQGTLKDAGNFSTPGYYLTNTGLREYDYSLNLGYKRNGFVFGAYYSSYYTKVGVYYGAESGNLLELLSKFNQADPGLPSYFSYDIGRPYQTVQHDLLKLSASRTLGNGGKLSLVYGLQNDIRQEFDVLTTTNPAAAASPQLRFQLITDNLDLVYTSPKSNSGYSATIGLAGQTSGNVFEGTRPLIPNYRDYNLGCFAVGQLEKGKFLFEAGLRGDYRWLRVYELAPSTLDLYNVTYQYTNPTVTIGANYRCSSNLSASLNFGTDFRSPSINEMYINGVHFSDASFQVGDSSLKSEKSSNTGLSIKYNSGKVIATLSGYYNAINNFIYDKPALQYRVLPSGAFPEFDYTQADVAIYGTDFTLSYGFLPNFSYLSNETIIRGYNQTISNWLVSMPADRFVNGLEFHLPHIRGITAPYIQVENVSVLKQTRVPPNSDYVPPPSGHSIFNAEAGFDLIGNKNKATINFSVHNFTNTAYREYLDHFRYYADELGINYALKIKYSF